MVNVLILGSSVAAGQGALKSGWVARWAQASKSASSSKTNKHPMATLFTDLISPPSQRPLKIVNHAVGGTTADYWLQAVREHAFSSSNNATSIYQNVDCIVLSLSAANEGLSLAQRPEDLRLVEEGFVAQMQQLISFFAKQAEEVRPEDKQREEAKPKVLIIGGPYPNDSYLANVHLPVLLRIRDRLREACKDIEFRTQSKPSKSGESSFRIVFIDFLRPDFPLHDGKGCWGTGLACDPSHPNDKGHEIMWDIFRKTILEEIENGQSRTSTFDQNHGASSCARRSVLFPIEKTLQNH
ncbi:unnamed protein product, partial [Amoebophrya sp. A25]|eukprot:GSA25T00014664001.1